MVRKLTIFTDYKENELEVYPTTDNTIRLHIKDEGSDYPGDWAFFDIQPEDLDALIEELTLAKLCLQTDEYLK